MKQQPIQRWLYREKSFSAFVNGPMLAFWKLRQERSFTGQLEVTIRYVCFTSPRHQRAILLVPGRIESYIKYPEVAFDLFSCGYDVFIIDHRGQGVSGRMLEDPHPGHVEHFSDYVDDLYTLYQRELTNAHYRHRFALAHSMGGAIVTLLLKRYPDLFTATALLAPMFGIVLPMPEWIAERILNWTEVRPTLRDGLALGTSRWHAPPFALNNLTHSRIRYQRNLRIYADQPGLQVGGPTAHWVCEAIKAGREIEAEAEKMTSSMMIIQAEEDQVVDNQAQNRFCAVRADAGNPCYHTTPCIMTGAKHEILFEKDDIRSLALNLVIDYFESACPRKFN